MSGIELIQAERHRQMNGEGWTPEHDDQHDYYQLTAAAESYCMFSLKRFAEGVSTDYARAYALRYWPWKREWLKTPEDPIRNLVKAGALIAAEIDRLQRIQERPDDYPIQSRSAEGDTCATE